MLLMLLQKTLNHKHMKKQLIILVCYINFGSITEQKTLERIKYFKSIFDETFSEKVQEETGTIIRTLAFPVRDQCSSVECIYPLASQMTEEDMKRIFDKIHDLQDEVKKLLEDDADRSQDKV
jgi:hypothetical protein